MGKETGRFAIKANKAKTTDVAKADKEQKGARPRNPLPKQKQRRPGIEKRVEPRPQYLAPDYKGSGKLKGKAALITGGDSGIGRAVAVLFAREGADVALIFLPGERTDAKETALQIEKEGRKALLIPGDLKDPKFCKRSVDKTAKEFGRLDILVNNAAFQQHQDSIEELPDDQFEKTFRTNIFAYFYMAKAAVNTCPRAVRS